MTEINRTDQFTSLAANPIAPNAELIDALSVAAEFIQCAVRAAAWGAPADSSDVQKPLSWAKEKMVETTTRKPRGTTPPLRD